MRLSGGGHALPLRHAGWFIIVRRGNGFISARVVESNALTTCRPLLVALDLQVCQRTDRLPKDVPERATKAQTFRRLQGRQVYEGRVRVIGTRFSAGVIMRDVGGHDAMKAQQSRNHGRHLLSQNFASQVPPHIRLGYIAVGSQATNARRHWIRLARRSV